MALNMFEAVRLAMLEPDVRGEEMKALDDSIEGLSRERGYRSAELAVLQTFVGDNGVPLASPERIEAKAAEVQAVDAALEPLHLGLSSLLAEARDDDG